MTSTQDTRILFVVIFSNSQVFPEINLISPHTHTHTHTHTCLLVILFGVPAYLDGLRNRVWNGKFQRTRIYLYIVVQKIFGQKPYFIWPCGRPHENLTVGLQTEEFGVTQAVTKVKLSAMRSLTRICPKIFRSCGSKPMSSILSASSTTK